VSIPLRHSSESWGAPLKLEALKYLEVKSKLAPRRIFGEERTGGKGWVSVVRSFRNAVRNTLRLRLGIIIWPRLAAQLAFRFAQPMSHGRGGGVLIGAQLMCGADVLEAGAGGSRRPYNV
jgi:hypothetical protein